MYEHAEPRTHPPTSASTLQQKHFLKVLKSEPKEVWSAQVHEAGFSLASSPPTGFHLSSAHHKHTSIAGANLILTSSLDNVTLLHLPIVSPSWHASWRRRSSVLLHQMAHHIRGSSWSSETRLDTWVAYDANWMWHVCVCVCVCLENQNKRLGQTTASHYNIS